MTPGFDPLLERDQETAALERALAATEEGRGQAVLISGGPGLGKTALLRQVEQQAGARGLLVLRARGHALESDFPLGGLLSVAEGIPSASRDPRLGAFLEDGRVPAEEPFTLYRATLRSVVDIGAPVVVAIDDLQWLDDPSQRFAHFVAVRAADHPLLVVCTARTGDDDAPVVAALGSEPGVTVLRPRPLSAGAVAAVLGGDGSTGDAVHAATAGNPLLVTELRRSGGEVEPQQMSPDDLARSVARTAIARLARLSSAGVRLATVAALLEDHAVDVVATVAGVSVAQAEALFDDLRSLGLVSVHAGVVRCGHPLVREAILDRIAPAERESLHERTAEILDRGGAPFEVVVPHVAAAPPRGSALRAEMLHRAARRAWSAGAPREAHRLLRRALAEPPDAARRPLVERDLVRAAATLGLDSWRRDLDDLLERTEAEQRWASLLSVGRALRVAGRLADAISVYREARRCAPDDGADLEVLAELGMATRIHVPVDLAPTEEILESVERPDFGAGTTERTLLGLAAYHLAVTNPSPAAVDLARRALRGGDGSRAALTPSTASALMALQFCDEHEEAIERMLELRHEARRRGAAHMDAVFANVQGSSELRVGRIDGAIELLDFAHEVIGEAESTMLPGVVRNRTETLLELGRVEDAEAGLALPGGEARWRESASFSGWLYARGLVREAQGDVEGALSDAERAGRRQDRMEARDPGSIPWQSLSIRALVRLGRLHDATARSEDELARCAGTTVRSARATALRGRALVVGPEERAPTLRRAREALAGSDLVRDRLWTDVAYGAALRARGDRSRAIEVLHEVHGQADKAGFVAVRERAEGELGVLGALERLAGSGPVGLTASERRVAELAATGASNRDVASQLYVSTKAVEFHLTNVYRKLHISRRSELADALARLAH